MVRNASDFRPVANTKPVARGLAPVGLRSGPISGSPRVPGWRVLRTPTGASPLATMGHSQPTLAKHRPTSEVGAICMLIGRDRSHGSIVRFRVRAQTFPISAATAFPTRKAP
ncbi:hypothetical protein FQ192_21075 [Pseudomonas sp. ANT_J12]|nr:hypothetical protein FQ192_21075 [Pseudomonas sp. ANT_J12]